MELFKKIIYNILKTLFCLYITLDIPYTHYVFWEQEVTMQMKIYMFILIVLAASNWVLLFSKINIKIKLTLIIMTILFTFSTHLFPDVEQAFRMESCLDSQICD